MNLLFLAFLGPELGEVGFTALTLSVGNSKGAACRAREGEGRGSLASEPCPGKAMALGKDFEEPASS